MSKRVLVVGAGLGGIATALRLAKQGYEVEILEKNQQAGGRLNQIKKDGFTFDTGPSFFSMSYEFEEFANECGIDLPFRYVELDPLYSVHIKGNPQIFHLYKDLDRLAEQFNDYEPGFRLKMEKYLKKSGALFDDTIDIVIKRNFNSLPAYLVALATVNPIHLPILFRSFYDQVKKHFTSKEARMIISLVAFFLGRTPFDTNAVYTLLSYTEFRHNGYFNVEGGMYKIVEGIVNELNKAKVKIHYNTEIVGYKEDRGKLGYFIDQTGKQWAADAFLVNSDAANFRHSVFNRKGYEKVKMDKMSWTMGYLTIYLGINIKLPEINHHNYYLGGDFESYSHNILHKKEVLDNPYYYVNVLSRKNPECAPEGCESLFFVCPVPNLLAKPDWSDKDQIVEKVIQDFSGRIGVNISDKIVSKTVYTPIDWQDQFNLYMGSGLGLSHSLGQIGGFRPPNHDEDFANVFYAGASTVPGAGLPMAIISSKLATQRIKEFSEKK